MEEKFEFVPVSDYDEVWNDSGSGANQDVSVWRPRVPAGCHLIGMTAKNGHSRPTFPTLVIRAGGRDIAPPERFDLVWWQERGRRRFWCWRPIPPAGYVSLGDVGTTSETPPSHKDVACVALACLSPNRQPLGGQIWNDRGGGAPKDAAFFEQPGGTGLFRCSDDATHNKPRGEFPIPAGTSTTPHTTQATNGIEILEAVVGKPVRFRINNPPSSNDAWVGIYHPSSSDQEIGKQKQQWEWLRDLDVNNASLTEKYEGNWSIRVFSDGGYRLHERKDFAVKPKHVATGRTRARPNKRPVIAAFVTGMFLFGIGLPLLIVGSTSTGEDRLAMIIPGAILFSVGSFSILVSAIGGLSLGGKSVPTQNTESTKPVQNPSIEVLEAVVGEPVLFRIKGQANHNDAWVGIYPSSLEDNDHGEEGDRWKWLKDIDVDSASFPEQSEGRWSIRVFKDGGYAVVSRVDFDILPKKERWWED